MVYLIKPPGPDPPSREGVAWQGQESLCIYVYVCVYICIYVCMYVRVWESDFANIRLLRLPIRDPKST